ncbi:cobalamin-binding protein [Ferribacterium limneticum]|uniref:cobalamin-binding protein n=1 Tax=Ferribacterium limneticum TaxID=76259 RepID=UPI001CF9B71A|nr:cobalamin-binding protein [Ferribacterium limneticum]UCV28678.1 cobalamin-binding protein [Ferribacterium limneticum]UCV32595.1 cobalamin-binding protein [Ferribacterium limneticum]
MPRLPQRIVCLTTETVEVLYALGEQERIVGISGYTVRPPEARKEKPKVFAFTSGDIDKILATQPDLVLTFSDLQSEISRDLIKAGVPVYAFNTRSVEDILGMVETVGRLVGAEAKALEIVAGLEAEIEKARAIAAERYARSGKKPRVYFEEWDEPLISGIRWASELIEIAGGEDIFAEQARSPLAKDRRPTPEAVISRAPDIIIGSWCGKHFRPERVAARPGWDSIPAVRNGKMHEIKSAIILTPGPVAISEGLPQLLAIFDL